MKKSLVSGIFTLVILLLCLCLMPTNAQSANESGLTFKLNSDGKSYTVTDCDMSASGSLTIPNSYAGMPVTDIGGGAFYGCAGLTDVTIPYGVTSIGDVAFQACSGLISITIPDSVISIGRYAFSFCDSLTNVRLSNNVTDITYQAFAFCSNLTNIKIPDGVVSIDARAFQDCTDLTYVDIPDSVTSIGENAFENCSGLTGIAIPEKVTSITYRTFSACTNLEAVVIPDSVMRIDQKAFAACGKLSDVLYCGTETQKQEMFVDTFNDDLSSANWHYEIVEAVYEGQNCYYCPKCDEYFLSGVLGAQPNAIGDFTNDNAVTNEDVIYLLWYTLFPESYPVESQADFTGDGDVTNEDVIYLLWHTLFPENYPLIEKKEEIIV